VTKIHSHSLTSLCLAVLLIMICLPAKVHGDRTVIDLSEYNWGLFRDFEADWLDDDIHLPPVSLSVLPVNPPSCGWDYLTSRIEKTVHLPSTIEEHFWGDNLNAEGTAGDYRGVSWWVTSINIDPGIEGKRVFLDFESVHLRAEVFVNRKLTGYDVIGHTPFSVDITDVLTPGETNEIAVRITDPLGNFSWNDRQVLKWGMHDIPPCHGFGGITGRVFLRAVDSVYIDDIYVKNKSSIKEVDVILTMKNLTGRQVSGNISVKVYPLQQPDEVLFEKRFRKDIPAGETTVSIPVKSRRAKLWDIDNPNLYIAEISYVSEDGKANDTLQQRFGFRWFDIGSRDGDQRFYLNGRRIVLRSGMSWGFWPVNGVYPTREMAERDVALTKEFGLTMMNFHRAIGQPPVMDAADEMGLLCYEESGGYSCEQADQNQSLWRGWRREKLLRMVKRDRSRPSLIMYNLQNRTPNGLTQEDIDNMRAAHEIDPTRIMTYMSGFWKPLPEEHPTKLFFKPNDFTEYYTGWFDMHMFSPAQSYTDACYNGPDDFTRYYGNPGDIVFWGEDGAINNPPRLELIKRYFERTGGHPGWQGKYFIEWYRAYDDFLDRSGFRDYFPDVDALTSSIGDVSLYYHGRIMENIRMGNITDCYTINGWGANQLTNHCDIADLYRNPVGNPEILARYCRPLYIAVKLRNKVVPAGSPVTADIFIVNESNLKGSHNLTVTLENENGNKIIEKNLKVKVDGGEEYGQLLAEKMEFGLENAPGYYVVRAALTGSDGKLKAEGSDDVFSVDLHHIPVPARGAVIDTSGVINRMMEKTWGCTLPQFSEETPKPDYIVIGPNTYTRQNMIKPVMECVANGATAVVISQADIFAGFISASSSNYFAVDYRGRYAVPRGNLIAGKHEVLSGLPQAQAFDWEYQDFTWHRRQNLYALRLNGGQTVVAAVSDHKKEVGTAVAVIPFGRGRVILSTLNMLPALDSDTPQSVVAKRLFLNYLIYASKPN